MLTRITTTIVTDLDLDAGLKPSHSVSIDATDALPRNVIMAAVQGALKSALHGVEDNPPAVVEED